MASPSVGDGSAKHIDGKHVDCALRAHFFFKRSATRLEGKPVDDAPPGTLMASLLVTAPPNTLTARVLIVRYARIFV